MEFISYRSISTLNRELVINIVSYYTWPATELSFRNDEYLEGFYAAWRGCSTGYQLGGSWIRRWSFAASLFIENWGTNGCGSARANRKIWLTCIANQDRTYQE
jgi:hypothetical protein